MCWAEGLTHFYFLLQKKIGGTLTKKEKRKEKIVLSYFRYVVAQEDGCPLSKAPFRFVIKVFSVLYVYP
jgi:hypothetical protein